MWMVWEARAWLGIEVIARGTDMFDSVLGGIRGSPSKTLGFEVVVVFSNVVKFVTYETMLSL